MLLVLFMNFIVDQNIINKCYHKLIQIIPKHILHKIHKVGRCIHKAKLHHKKLIVTALYSKLDFKILRLDLRDNGHASGDTIKFKQFSV